MFSARGASANPLLGDHVQRLVRAFGTPSLETFALPVAPVHDPLTPKELRVLALLAEGYSNAALGEKLFVSENTIRSHLRRISNKLGATSRTQAVSIARRLSLL